MYVIMYIILFDCHPQLKTDRIVMKVHTCMWKSKQQLSYCYVNCYHNNHIIMNNIEVAMYTTRISITRDHSLLAFSLLSTFLIVSSLRQLTILGWEIPNLCYVYIINCLCLVLGRRWYF